MSYAHCILPIDHCHLLIAFQLSSIFALMNTTNNSIHRLRLAGIAEGISLLVLLGIAMPIKYLLQQPAVVQVVGWIHGLLFVIFMMLVFMAWLQRYLSLQKAALAFVAAFLPFGTFIFDRYLKRIEAEKGN